ncbi:MAG: hypothetical protein ACFNLH_03035 [Corynebacterium matruchotii]
MAAAPTFIPTLLVSITATEPSKTAEAATAADQVADRSLERCNATTPASPPRSSWRA